MLDRLLFLAALALPAPPSAQDARRPPQDPNCPREGSNRPTGPEWACNGRLTPAYAFAFVYPASAARIPALKAELSAQAMRDQFRLAAEAEALAGRRAPGGLAIPILRYDAEWRVDAVTPELAAASAEIATYAGGAHGGIEYRAILVDRRDDRPIRLVDLFEPNLFEHSLLGQRLRGMRAVQAAFCRALTALVRERLGEPAAEVRCPGIEVQPVTFVCGPRGRIETMRALLNLSIAGSRAQGAFEVDFPVDARMIGNMYRRYRVAFGLPHERRGRPRPC
jgi:hypothetical protein